ALLLQGKELNEAADSYRFGRGDWSRAGVPSRRNAGPSIRTQEARLIDAVILSDLRSRPPVQLSRHLAASHGRDTERATRQLYGDVAMVRAVAVRLVLIVVVFSGCASTSPPHPTARPFENLRRLVVVASGDTTFAVTEHSAEPGRTFDEIL